MTKSIQIVDGNYGQLAIYNRLKQDNLLETFVYSRQNLTPEEWCEVVQEGWLFAVMDGNKAMGIAWMTGVQGRMAYIHFCPYRAYFDQVTDYGHYVISWVRDVLQVKTLCGLTPKIYRHARKQAKIWGFEEKFVVPEACYLAKLNRHVDGVIMMKVL